MKAITIKPQYNIKGLTNVIRKDSVAFVDIHGEEVSPWQSEEEMIKNFLAALGEEE